MAKANHKRFDHEGKTITIKRGALDGITDALPAIPGGLVTYVIGGYLAWRFLIKKE